eukprot:11173678-Lingulodinium_polyedra.AAC.1
MVESTATLRNVLQTLHKDAVESTARHRSGSRNARSRTPCARHFLLYCANARFAAADCRWELLECYLNAA